LLEDDQLQVGQLARRLQRGQAGGGAAHHPLHAHERERQRQVEQPEVRLRCHAEKDGLVRRVAAGQRLGAGLDPDRVERELDIEPQGGTQIGRGDAEKGTMPCLEAFHPRRRQRGRGGEAERLVFGLHIGGDGQPGGFQDRFAGCFEVLHDRALYWTSRSVK
jgi:hypothetical protein